MFLLAILAALTPGNSGAQVLQRLTVTAFTLSPDTGTPYTGVPFHLVITLRVRERIIEVRNLELPELSAFDVLGDERMLTASRNGSVYQEIVTVETHHPGKVDVGPAAFEAVDARDGRAKQYSSNSVIVDVTQAPAERFAAFAEIVLRVLYSALVALLVLGIGLAFLGRRSRRVAPPIPPREEPVVQEQPAVSPRERIAQALTFLDADPTRAGAMRARGLLYRMVGAFDGETLHDVMQRARVQEPILLEILPSIERAAFTYDEDVSKAISAARDALKKVLS